MEETPSPSAKQTQIGENRIGRLTAFCSRYQVLLVFLAAVLASFLTLGHQLALGIEGDDTVYERALTPSTPWIDLLNRLSPTQQLGYPHRPVYLLYYGTLRHFLGGNWPLHHAAALMLHAAVVTVIFVFVRQLGLGGWAALATAVIFHLFPGKEQASGWLCANSTLLAALFSVACLSFWFRWDQTGRRVFWSGSLICFLLALWSKQDVFMLPFILPAFQLIVCRSRSAKRGIWKSALELWWILPLTALVGWQNVVNSHVVGAFAQYLRPEEVTTDPVQRLRTVLNFTGMVFLGAIDIRWSTVLIAAVATLFVAKINRVALFIWVWFCFSVIPAPAFAGGHSIDNGRFHYVPALALAAFFGAMIPMVREHWQKDRILAYLAMAVVIHITPTLLGEGPPLAPQDPISAWVMVCWLAALLGYLRFRLGWSGRFMPLLFGLLAATATTRFLPWPNGSDFLGIFALAALAVRSKDEIPAGILLGLMGFANPIVPLIAVCLVEGYEVAWPRLAKVSKIVPMVASGATTN